MDVTFKIYKAYYDTQKLSLYFNELKALTGLSNSSLQNALKNLIKEKTMIKNKTKSNAFYRIIDVKKAALYFSLLAIDQFRRLDVNIRIPLENFSKNLPKSIYTIVLFGSVAQGNENNQSDIDLLVVSNNPINISRNKKEAELTSQHPLSIISCSLQDLLENKDELIIQAKQKGFPIYKEQNFYEALLNESRTSVKRPFSD